MVKKKASKSTRERQCVIESKTLDDILRTCDRNIRNICMTRMDLIENEDGTPTDFWYIEHYKESWEDLREDVAAMLAQRDAQPVGMNKIIEQAKTEKKTAAIDTKYYAYIIEGTEREAGWGQRPDGVVAFATEEMATAWIADYYKRNHTSKTTPHDYTTYDKIGIKEVSFETFKKIDGQHAVHADRLHELQ